MQKAAGIKLMSQGSAYCSLKGNSVLPTGKRCRNYFRSFQFAGFISYHLHSICLRALKQSVAFSAIFSRLGLHSPQSCHFWLFHFGATRQIIFPISYLVFIVNGIRDKCRWEPNPDVPNPEAAILKFTTPTGSRYPDDMHQICKSVIRNSTRLSSLVPSLVTKVMISGFWWVFEHQIFRGWHQTPKLKNRDVIYLGQREQLNTT